MKQTFTGVQILRFVAAMLVAWMHITQALAVHIAAAGSASYLWVEKPLIAAFKRLLFRRPARPAYSHAANTASE